MSYLGYKLFGENNFQVGCKIDRTSAQEITSGLSQLLLFNDEVYDPYGMHSTITNSGYVFVPENGYYLAICGVQWSANSTGQRTLLMVGYGGVAQSTYDSREAGTGGTFTYQNLSDIYYLSSGDYIGVTCIQNSGSTLTVGGSATYTSYLSVQRIA